VPRAIGDDDAFADDSAARQVGDESWFGCHGLRVCWAEP
jgi:hypothetical protein